MKYLIRFLLFTVVLTSFMCSVTMALLLRTMQVVNGTERVAQVVMYPIEEDQDGRPYIDIEYTPIRNRSALFSILNVEDEIAPGEELTLGETQNYRIYGDTVAVRGPLVSLRVFVQIVGFGNIYKLAIIEGEYRNSSNQSAGEGSEFYINGGFAQNWWEVNSREASFPYNMFVQRITFSGDEEPGFRPGMFGGDDVRRYEIVVTINSITWQRID